MFADAARRSVLPIATGAVETGGSKSSCSIINVGAGGVRAVTTSWSLGPDINDRLREINNTSRAKYLSSFSSYSLKSSVIPNRSSKGIGYIGGEGIGEYSSG